MLQAVVFDFDGLILDTESGEFHAFRHVCESYGVTLSLEVWKDCIGTDASAFDPYAYLERNAGRAIDREAVREARKRRFAELMQHAEARPGVQNYLQRAAELKLRIGLASSSSRAWVEGYLEQLGLKRYFECICTSDDVPKVKPDPRLYQLALERLGVAPRQAVAFEDSPNGALAARRAGMRCVIVPNALTRTLVFGEHDLRLESMADMSLDEVLKRLEAMSDEHR